MPELAEVELARRIWARAEGQVVREVEVTPEARIYRDLPAGALQILIGKTNVSSVRHGKRMYFTYGDEIHIEIHLGMSGKVYRAERDYEHRKHDHLILRMDDCALILNDYRMFGKVSLHEREEPWASLAPDPLSSTFNQNLVKELVESKPNKILKGALLAQDLFPGVGNWMVDEICWRLGVHPAVKLGHVNAEDLYKTVKFVCKGAIRYVADRNDALTTPPSEKGFTAGGYVADVPPANWLFQHRWKKGGICPRCRAELERGTIATRTTAWCPTCQAT